MRADFANDLEELICPHCRHKINRGRFFYRPAHFDLLDTPPFRPSRWDGQGYPLDAKETLCRKKACPACKQPLPDHFGLPGCEYWMISLVGQAYSGKSYYLATMIEGLATPLGKCGLSLNDEDPEMNSNLWQLSSIPFQGVSPKDDSPKNDSPKDDSPISRYIDKTLDDNTRTYSQIELPGLSHRFSVPKPFSFRIGWEHSDETYLRFVLYDNEGEAFTATGHTRHAEEKRVATGHLAHSELILILIDPLPVATICQAINRELNPNPVLHSRAKEATEQLTMIDEIRQRAARNDSPPVAVMVGKWDVWANLKAVQELQADSIDANGRIRPEIVDRNSEILRKFLSDCRTNIPEKLSTFTSSENLRYFPVSSLGHPTTKVFHQGRGAEVDAPSRPAEPKGVVAPMIWGIRKIKERESRSASS